MEYIFKRKKIVFYVLPFLLMVSAITISGCKTSKSETIVSNTIPNNTIPDNPISDTAIANNTIPDNNIPDDGKSFPFSMRGTWKRENFNHTLTFTQDKLKASNQSYTWSFQGVTGDVYKISPGNYKYTHTLTLKLNNGNLEISGDGAANFEYNWNGTWKKQ